MGHPVIVRRMASRGGYAVEKTLDAAKERGIDPTVISGVEQAAFHAAWAAAPTGPVVGRAVLADAPWKEVFDRVFEENLPVA